MTRLISPSLSPRTWQGAELAVLRGGEELARRAQFILMELPFMGEYNRGAPTFSEAVNFMERLVT